MESLKNGSAVADETLGSTGTNATDSILIRKNRLRRILSGSRLPSASVKEKDLEAAEMFLEVTKGHVGQGDCTLSAATVEKDGLDNFRQLQLPVNTWTLDEDTLLDAFLVLFDEVDQHQNKDPNAQFFLDKFEPVVSEVKGMRVNLNDFQLGKVLSKGTFSSVRLIREKANKRILTLKVIQKFHGHVQKWLPLIDAELYVLSKHSSQWLLNFHYAFQDKENIYFVLEHMAGGNYPDVLKRNGGRLSEDMAKFYLAEMVLAVNAVHSLGFALRNLKPEDLLFDSMGHLKLSEFGSASRLTKDGLVSFPLPVNEACYEAPEILRTLGNNEFNYGIACDFWSIGIIAFETVFGSHPYKTPNAFDTFKQITLPKSKETLKFPKQPNISSETKEFITNLLLEQKERLKYDDCLRHPFFNSVIWDGIRNEVAPSIPPMKQVKEEEDFSLVLKAGGDLQLFDTKKRPISNVSFVGFTRSQSESHNPTYLLDNSSVLDSSMSINEEANHASTVKNSKLLSELELKTECIKEKLNEIQILQTQLQNSATDLKDKEAELARFKGEVKRLTLDLEQVHTKIAEDKEMEDQLDNKLQELKVCAQESIMIDLKDAIKVLNETVVTKDTQIIQLTKDVDTLRHEVRILVHDKQNLIRKEEEMEGNLARKYRGSISLMETRVTRSSATLEARIKELEAKLKEERITKRVSTSRNSSNEEAKLRETVRVKCNEIAELQGRMEETRQAREATLEELRLTRKRYGETMNQLQETVEESVEKYLEMKEMLERERDPAREQKVAQLESLTMQYKEENAELKAQLNECERVKRSEAMKAQQLNDLVQQLGESVQSLQQQKLDIFESTKEFFRQNQDSESLKGAQRVLEEQLMKTQEALDASKESLFDERRKVSELTSSMELMNRQVADCQAVIRVLTVQKEEVENDLTAAMKKCKESEDVLNAADAEIKELTKSNAKQAAALEDFQKLVLEAEADMNELKNLFDETKVEKSRLEAEILECKDGIRCLEEEISGSSCIRVQLQEMEINLQEKDCQLAEKVQELESVKTKMELLQESCVILENQLERMESIVTKKEEELQTELEKSASWTENMRSMEEEVKAAKREANQALSMQTFAEKQLANARSQKKNEEESKSTLISQLSEKNNEIRKKYDEKLTEYNTMVGKLEQAKQEKRFFESLTNELKGKQGRLHVELTRYLDSIVEMKEKLIHLRTDLQEEKQKGEFYRDRAGVLIEEKELVEMDRNTREAELQATINQQVKLIQFFQGQAQLLSAKKKRFRFFGRDKELDLPPPPPELLEDLPTTTGMVPRTPVSAAKTPQSRLMNPQSIPKIRFDDDVSSDDESDVGTCTSTGTFSSSES